MWGLRETSHVKGRINTMCLLKGLIDRSIRVHAQQLLFHKDTEQVAVDNVNPRGLWALIGSWHCFVKHDRQLKKSRALNLDHEG